MRDRDAGRARRTVRASAVAAWMLVAVAVPVPVHAQDGAERRLYLGVRIGESNPITKAHDVASVSIGANLDRHLGAELSFDAYELLLGIPGNERVAELSVLSFVPQLRLRYPLLDDRLVPYFLAGAGFAVAQINDANEPTVWSDGGSLTSIRPMGVVGGGVEYYISDDIAAGVEGKYLMTGSEAYDAGGTPGDVNIDAGVLTFGLRMFYPERDPTPAHVAAARSARRFYLNVRFGGALRMAGDVFPGLRTEPEQRIFGSNFAPLFAVGIGTQLADHLDIEVSASNYELRLLVPGGGSSDYSVFPILLQPKLHFPTGDPRLDPYLLAGVGAEVGEPNDGGSDDVGLTGNSPSVIGAFGAGVDYFATSDVALGLELKYVISRGHTLRVGDGPARDGDLDALFLSLGVRTYLFAF